MTITFDILNRFTNEAIYTAEIDCADDVPFPVKKGLAVKQAVKDGADLRCADLSYVDLRGVNLSYSDLIGVFGR